METISILDVTSIEPRLKHPTIFQKLDSLLSGQALILHNDHDPKPLYYQLQAEHGGIFDWEYLENGPKIWKVKITKSDKVKPEETIGEIVARDYRKAQVFKKFGIDFCCGGKKTLTEACQKKGIAADEVKKELAEVDRQAQTPSVDFQKWDLGFLADYIINTHHRYIKENTQFITELAQKVARVHGDIHPEVIGVAETFLRVGQDLLLHVMKEEKVLFPSIKALANAEKTGVQLPEELYGRVSNPIRVMESEHEQAGDDFEQIRELTSNYQIPADACTSYSILYKKLDEFENDLHQHVHLENNILFPKAIALENEWFGRGK